MEGLALYHEIKLSSFKPKGKAKPKQVIFAGKL